MQIIKRKFLAYFNKTTAGSHLDNLHIFSEINLLAVFNLLLPVIGGHAVFTFLLFVNFLFSV